MAGRAGGDGNPQEVEVDRPRPPPRSPRRRGRRCSAGAASRGRGPSPRAPRRGPPLPGGRAARAIRGPASATQARASSAAAPRPASRGTLSVPLRSPCSCPPPWRSGARRSPERTKRAPHPLGRWNLWAERERRSTPSRRTSRGILPAACTASVCRGTFASRQTAASSAMGWIVPVSLLARITETSRASGRRAAPQGLGVDEPPAVDGEAVDAHPFPLQGPGGLSPPRRAPAARGSPAPRGPAGPLLAQDAVQGQVVRLGPRAGEDDLPRPGADQAGRLLPCPLHRRPRPLRRTSAGSRGCRRSRPGRVASPRRRAGRRGSWRCGRSRCAPCSAAPLAALDFFRRPIF